MSLLHPTLGELYDRAVILQIKICKGRDKGVPVTHFEDELAAIAEVIKSRPVSMTAVVRKELLETHEALWDLVEASPPELLRLNARRVALREEIDRASGEYRGPEKV